MRNAALRQAYRAGFWVLWVAALVRRPHALGVKALLKNGGDVLLVRHTYGFNEWELPGGGQRRHETPRQAITRELREELGIEVADVNELGTCNGPKQYRNNVVSFFGIELASRSLTPDPVEIAEVRWCDPSDPPQPLGWYATEALARNGKAIALP